MSKDRKQWEDEDSFEGLGLLQAFRGVPHDVQKTKGELHLAQQEDMRNSLSAIRDRLEGGSLEYPTLSGEVLPPEMHVDVEGLADELAPQFDELIDSQRELQDSVEHLGWLGQRALEATQVTNDHLEILGSQGAQALRQRNTMIDRMVQGNSHLFSIDQRVTGVLNGIERSRATMIDLLQDVGPGIRQITKEQVETRMAVVDALRDIRGVFFTSHREQMMMQRTLADLQGGVLHALRNPRATQALEAWRIGEQCREIGDFNTAIRILREGERLNPAEPRIHLSFAMLETAAGSSMKAVTRFQKSASFAQMQGDNKLAAYAKMKEAKMLMFEQEFSQALKVLEDALEADIWNFECWYELSYCACKLHQYPDARKSVIILIKHSEKYKYKVLTEPLFRDL